MKYFAHRAPSPCGDIWMVAGENGALVQLDFAGGRNAPRRERDLEAAYRRRGRELVFDSAPLAGVTAQLEAYFAGDLRAFDVFIDPEGTDFQKRVWSTLLEIPYGVTWSYGELARRVGSPGGARAVGAANGANPVSIIVPCHRVIGSNGALTGYGGGMERKRALLELEGALLPLA